MTKRQACGGRLWVALGTLVLAAGCGDRGGTEGTESAQGGEVERGGTAILTELADASQPMILLAATALDVNLSGDIMSMELVRGRWGDGRTEYMTAEESPMALARRYEYVGPDSSALRFHMRSDVRWSDGTPLTAHDVAFTYRLVKDPALASPRQDQVERLDSVVAENDSTVTLYFERRYPEMLTHSGLAPVPRHVYEGVDPAQIANHPSVQNPAEHQVVSGPWRIGRWERGQRIVLVPNPHFRPRPNLDQIVIRIIPDPTTRLVELQTGNVDMVQSVTYDQIPRLKEQAPHVRFERERSRFFEYIAYNPEGFAPFGDPEIRRALGMAIDVPALIRGLQMEEYTVPAGGPYSPIQTGLYDPELMPPLPYDPEAARRMLESKGWRDSDGDGVLDRDGRPFRFTMITNTGNQRRADAMQIAQQQWKRIGVDAQLQTVEFNNYFDSILNRKYQAALGGWGVALAPDFPTSVLFGSDAPYNITGYRNPEMERLAEQARAQPTREAAEPFWRQTAAEIARDQPYTWLYYYDSMDGVHERLRDVKIDSYGPYQNTWEWWIPRSQQRGGAPAAADTQP